MNGTSANHTDSQLILSPAVVVTAAALTAAIAAHTDSTGSLPATVALSAAQFDALLGDPEAAAHITVHDASHAAFLGVVLLPPVDAQAPRDFTAAETLAGCLEAGFDRVVVVGYKDGELHTISSALDPRQTADDLAGGLRTMIGVVESMTPPRDAVIN